MNVTVTPAYGRDYKSAKDAKADWDANKDFVINCFSHPYDGSYINKEQVTNESITIRFDKLRKTCQV